MKRSVRAALGVVIVALALPAAALAMHHHSAGGLRHHGHGHARIHDGATGNSGAPGSSSVTSYADGTLVLALAGGGSITGAVTQGTRFVCIGQGWGDQGLGGRGRGSRGGRYNSRRNSGSTGSTGWTGPTGSTGRSGSSGGRGGTGGTGSSGRQGWSGPSGATGRHGYTPPPCDSSLLVSGAPVSSADVAVTPGGVLFSEIVLLPAVQ
jgi:hypothetical protein